MLAWADCCKLNMTMAVLDTPEEITCVADALAGENLRLVWSTCFFIFEFVAAMTTQNKLSSTMLRLYGSNMNFVHTYHWCDHHTLLDPAIAGSLDFVNASSLALFYDAAAPANSKIVSDDFGAVTPLLCED